MLYLHIVILLLTGSLFACSTEDKTDKANKDVAVDSATNTENVIVGKSGGLGMRDFRSISTTMKTITGVPGYSPSRLLPRSQELTAFSPTVQVGIYKRANGSCAILTSLGAHYECRKQIEKTGRDISSDCTRAKKTNIAFANAFTGLKFSGSIKDDLSPVMRHKIAATLIDNFWGRVASAPPAREQSIAAVVAFLDEVAEPLIEHYNQLKKEGIHTEGEMAKKLQEWHFKKRIYQSTDNVILDERFPIKVVVNSVLNQACTAVLASAPMVFY